MVYSYLFLETVEFIFLLWFKLFDLICCFWSCIFELLCTVYVEIFFGISIFLFFDILSFIHSHVLAFCTILAASFSASNNVWIPVDCAAWKNGSMDGRWSELLTCDHNHLLCLLTILILNFQASIGMNDGGEVDDDKSLIRIGKVSVRRPRDTQFDCDMHW